MRYTSALLSLIASACLFACGGGGSSPTTAQTPVPSPVLSTYTISGAVSGLSSGDQMSLVDNATDSLAILANGPFTFKTAIEKNGTYTVTLLKQPAGKLCTVSNGLGANLSANITNVSVVCSPDSYAISGSVTGLTVDPALLNSGLYKALELSNNTNDQIRITANGNFAFPVAVAYNSAYAVTVKTQPTGQTCTVSNASGSGVTANVFNISVTCAKSTLSIGGNVSGLSAGQEVTILNNGADALIIKANGSFGFVTPVAYGSSYSVTVSAQPTGQTCSVSSGANAFVSNNVLNVSVNCASITYTVGGILSGLISSITPPQQVTLYNNNSNPLIVSSNGAFVFTTPIAYGSNYSVTVGTQPSKETCAVSNSSGVNIKANASNVTVLCQAMVWTVSNFSALTNPYALAVGGTAMYVAEPVTSKITKVILATGVTSEAGGSGLPGYKDTNAQGDALLNAQNCITLMQGCIYPWDAQFNAPSGVAVDASGNVYVADSGNNVIRKINFSSTIYSGVVTTLAGSTAVGKVNGTGTAASFNAPAGIAIDTSIPPNFYVSDSGNNLIRKITSAGVVTTFAGSGLVGKTNGAALSASFNRPTGIAVDILGNVYVADSQNALIRKITPQGIVSTLAGSGAVGYANGLSENATFFNPTGVAIDSSGNVYVADTSNNAIRAISQAGVVTTLAGSTNGVAGDVNGVGATARFNNPTGITIDTNGKIYVAEANNVNIRLITPTITPQ